MAKKTLRQRILAGEQVSGALMFEFFSPGVPQLLANAGAEFVLYDMEHTGISLETVKTQVALCRGVGITPLVRVPRAEYHFRRADGVGRRSDFRTMIISRATRRRRCGRRTRAPW